MTPTARRIFMYMEMWPKKAGSGLHMRLFSNVRAYLDLGFEVEAVRIGDSEPDEPPAEELPAVRWSRVDAQGSPPSIAGRLFYRAGFPSAAACRFYFPRHAAAHREALRREHQYPGSLHHFESDPLANVIPFLSRSRTIWSHHDFLSEIVKAGTHISCELHSRPAVPAELRELRFVRNYEKRTASASHLILCISEVEAQRLRSELGISAAQHLPMSIPDETLLIDWRQRRAQPPLALLHLGKLNHLPSFRSLELLLGEVFPRLPVLILDQICLKVVGGYDPQEERCRKILQLQSRYPQVELLGYLPSLTDTYKSCHLQVVASTEATGLRTRIIESFAFGLPVLSTPTAALGITGLLPGENIFLAGTAEEFARSLTAIVMNTEQLGTIAARARSTYEELHGRVAVARTLAAVVEKTFGVGRSNE